MRTGHAVRLLPFLKQDQIAAFLSEYGYSLTIDCPPEGGTRLIAHPIVTVPQTLFACDRCEWEAPEPVWVQTGDTFQPPRGEVPCCPCCGSFMVTLKLSEDTCG